jgi:PAS domain S-box-containing protein
MVSDSDDLVQIPARRLAMELPSGAFRALLEHMSEGVSLSAEDGTIVYTNPAEDRMFGYAPGEMIGQHVSIQNAYPPVENARVVAEVIAELKRSGAWRGEWLNRRKDGSTFVTTSRITAVDIGGAPHRLSVH